MKIVIPDLIWGVPSQYWDELRSIGAEVYDDYAQNRENLLERIKDAEIMTINYFEGDKELIDSLPKLKYIISPAVGYDWIDAEYAKSKGVKVLNCPTFVPLAVAEHAMALLLTLAKRIPEAHGSMKNGLWAPNDYVGFELSGKKLGLVGYGNIGKYLDKMASGFGMSVEHVDSKSSSSELDELLALSDVVCLCLPLDEKTRGLIDGRRLGLLKKTAYLINVARGAIIDQGALLESLQNNTIAGAGLDVFVGEPGSSGEISEQIRSIVSLPNVVATPHSAFNTPESLDRLGAEIVTNIKSCIEGSPINVVN